MTVATKADLKTEIAPLKAELRAVRWMLGLILSVPGVVAAFVIAVGVRVFGVHAFGSA